MEFAVIFDMDGVIVDSNPWHKRSLEKFLRQHGRTLPEAELKEKVYGRPNRDWLPRLFGGDLSPDEVRRLAEEKERLFREMYAETVTLLPGLPEFIDACRGADVPLAIATSAPRANLDFVLEKTELSESAFAVILDDRHFDKGKPDPQIYLRTAEALGLPPAKCFVFEDSLSGIQAALCAGTQAIGVTTTHSPEELRGALLTIGDFREISPSDLSRLAHGASP